MRVSTEKACWDFDWDFIKHMDHFAEHQYPNNMNFQIH